LIYSRLLRADLTFDRKGEKGNPPSLAKDQICRDAVAISAITAQTSAMTMIATITLVAARLFVML